MTSESHGRSGQPNAASLLLRAFFIAAAVYLLVKIILLTTYSIHTRFVMDEYESIGAWVGIPAGLYQDVIPVRTLLAAYFYQTPRLLVDGSNEVTLFLVDEDRGGPGTATLRPITLPPAG